MTSAFASPEALLQELQWPARALQQKGTLTWSAATATPPAAYTCVVLVKADAIVCRVRSMDEERMTSMLESSWSWATGALEYRGSRKGEAAVALDEADALQEFKSFVALMASSPAFQAMGSRPSAGVPAESIVSSSRRPSL